MLSLFAWLLRQAFVFPYLYETAHLSQTLSKLELAVQHFYMDGVLITLCCYKVTACGNRSFFILSQFDVKESTKLYSRNYIYHKKIINNLQCFKGNCSYKVEKGKQYLHKVKCLFMCSETSFQKDT